MFRAKWTRLLLSRCQDEHLVVFGQSSQIRKALVSDWFKNSDDKEDPSKVFNIFKDRLTQKLGDRLDKNHQNGFKLFNMEEKFDIDQHRLQNEMRKLQRLLHPDQYISKSLKTQETSIQLSAMVNDFYRTLSHPYERGKYLLSLMTKTDSDELEKKLGDIKMDNKFLMRMMDISEKVQSPTTDTMALRKLSSELDKDLNDLTRQLKEDFSSKRFDNIYKNLGKLKFIANCHLSIVDRIGSLDDF